MLSQHAIEISYTREVLYIVYRTVSTIFFNIDLKWRPQREKTLSPTTGERVAMKLCTRGCIERTWLSSEPVLERFFGVLRGERACCCMLGLAIVD